MLNYERLFVAVCRTELYLGDYLHLVAAPACCCIETKTLFKEACLAVQLGPDAGRQHLLTPPLYLENAFYEENVIGSRYLLRSLVVAVVRVVVGTYNLH